MINKEVEIFKYLNLLFFLFLAESVNAASNNINQNISNNTFGNPGIIDIPVAGSFEDGRIGFSSSKFGANLRNTLQFQALPRVFAAFRYSGIGDREKWYYDSGYTTWDRSFDLRVDLLKENNFYPELTLGLQDIIGTGIYSGEYLVASKNLFSNLRLTGGLGWGRLGSGNTLIKGGKRDTHSGGKLGGVLRYENSFKGNIGGFGGIEYSINKFKFNIEKSSDTYIDDAPYTKRLPASDINYGVEYNFNENLDLSTYFMHGNEIGLQLNLKIIPSEIDSGTYLEDIPQPFYSQPMDNQDMSFWSKVISKLKEEENIDTVAFKTESEEAIIIIENNHYYSEIKALGRTLRILSRYVPYNFKNFIVIMSSYGIPLTKIEINRDEVASIIDAPNSEVFTNKIVKISDSLSIIENANISKNQKMKGYWNLDAFYNFHFFDPNRPVYYDIGAEFISGIKIRPGFYLENTIEFPILTTFDEVWRGEKGSLPHVRTNQKNFLNETDPKIKDLTINSLYKISSNTYGRLTAGYLEYMYSGISSEILFAPVASNLAFGAELNYLKPRDYRQLFKFQEINGLSKINGHISTYWDTNYYNYFSQLDLGKYMAGDNGATLTITRKYPNGWEVGGFFTLTDATFREFGEGSFDKGFFLSLPFHSLGPIDTKYTYKNTIRPIQGDGGARVQIPNRLHPIISRFSKNNLNKSWPTIWR